jgi:exocyst complex component 2
VTLVRKGNDGDGLPASAPVSSDKENWKTRSFLKSRKEGSKIALKDEVESQIEQAELPAVRDHAIRDKVMYHSEKFDPKVFLARIHQNTSAADLEAGEDALREDLQSRKNQLKKLVKDHFDCFISCKNTIDDIHTKLQQIESAGEGTGTLHLSNAIQEVDSVAKRAFAPLLERQAQAERIRSVQGMLQRFRTLFNLPSMIRANISKGEYDLAIREYKKAKSLVLYSHVGILSRVLEEVDKIIQQFKDMLYKKMEDPHVEISQLENTIRLLLELEPDSDPVWHYLTIQDRRIRGLLEACSLEHDVRMDALHGRVRERVQSDARWKQLQRESNKASNVDFNLLLGNNDKEIERTSLKDSTGNESDALLGRLIRRLTSVIVTHLPSFWSLALSIFNGKFSKVTGAANGAFGLNKPSVASNNESGQYPFEEAAESKIASHSVEEVVTMVHCIIALYESKVRTSLTSNFRRFRRILQTLMIMPTF